jgi:hypothetical protein
MIAKPLSLSPFVVALVAASALAPSASAQDVPPEKQKGVRGRVVVAAELPTTAVPLSPEREAALRGAAIVRRPIRVPKKLSEPPGALVVMLEGDGIRDDKLESPRLVLAGMRLTPGSLVVPRVITVEVENQQGVPVTFVDAGGAEIGKAAAGQVGQLTLKPGVTFVRVKEMPFATASVRVLERGRALPLKNGEIPLTDITGGTYMLTFFLGSEPLRAQELSVPDLGLVFIDATVSEKGVVDVSIKDASQRVALPPSGVPNEAPPGSP